jgi:transcription-repair coupling factor (superfamily II helicase)
VRNLLNQLPEYKQALAALQRGQFPLFITGAGGSCRALLGAALYEQGGYDGALLVVAPGLDQVPAWLRDLESLLPDREILLFDPAEALPFEVVAASREPTAGRLRVLAALRDASGRPPVVVAPAEALLPKLIPPSSWEQAALHLAPGSECDLTALPGQLVYAGYERVDLVAAPGQFALRGSILDIFPFQGVPVRLEFWGDEITSLKELDPASQRSLAARQQITVWPAREFIYAPGEAGQAGERIMAAYRVRREQLRGNRSANVRLQQRQNRFLEMAEEGLSGSLNLVQPYFYPKQASLLDYLPKQSLVVVDEPGRFQEQCRAHIALLESDYRRLFQEGQSFTPWQEYYLTEDELHRDLESRPLIGLGRLLSRPGRFQPRESVHLTVKEMQPFLARPDLLAPEVQRWLQHRAAVVLLTQTEERLERLEQNLRDHDLAPLVAKDWPLNLVGGRLQMGVGQLSQGF